MQYTLAGPYLSWREYFHQRAWGGKKKINMLQQRKWHTRNLIVSRQHQAVTSCATVRHKTDFIVIQDRAGAQSCSGSVRWYYNKNVWLQQKVNTDPSAEWMFSQMKVRKSTRFPLKTSIWGREHYTGSSLLRLTQSVHCWFWLDSTLKLKARVLDRDNIWTSARKFEREPPAVQINVLLHR